MFRLFETALNPTLAPARPEPPSRLVAFYWHFARQAKGLFAALFVAGFLVAVLEFDDPGVHGAGGEPRHDERSGRCCGISPGAMLLGMAAVLLFVRPLALTAQNLVANQAISANVSNMIRWQNHWHVARQSWAFFQNDFAGRIASRVLQTGPAVRESLVALITGVWYILVYGTSALFLLASADPLARAADLGVVCRLCGAAAHFRAAHARPLEAGIGGALDAHRARRRHLHQYPHGETVRPRPPRGRLCARRHRGAHRAVLRVAAAQYAVRLLPVARSTPCWSPAPAPSPSRCGCMARSRSAPSRWRCRCRGRSSASPAGWRCGSPKFSRTSASCRKA